MSALTRNDWSAEGAEASRAALAGVETASLAEKLFVLRDTLIVFSMQVVFRATMFLRHLNY